MSLVIVPGLEKLLRSDGDGWIALHVCVRHVFGRYPRTRQTTAR